MADCLGLSMIVYIAEVSLIRRAVGSTVLMLQQTQVNLISDLGVMFPYQRIFTPGIAIVTLIP